MKLTFLVTTLPFTRTRTVFVAVTDLGTPITTDCDTGPRAMYVLTAPEPAVANA